jgi:intracellular sulfur oxidation DsrE/DsrF family protein
MVGLGANLLPNLTPHVNPGDEWDFSWTKRLTGKRAAVFDVTELEGGLGVFRAATWAAQCVGILGVEASNVAPVIVLRSHAVALAFTQAFWDNYSVGRTLGATLPLSDKVTARNPVLMDEKDGLPASLASGTLPKQMERGVTVLACNVAIQAWVEAVRSRDKLSAADSQSKVVGALLPGVILQPSGILAAIVAQENGAAYLKAN